MTEMNRLGRLATVLALALVAVAAAEPGRAEEIRVDVLNRSGPNKAFAIAGDSRFGWATGRRTMREEALRLCVSGKSAKCWIANANNKPVE